MKYKKENRTFMFLDSKINPEHRSNCYTKKCTHVLNDNNTKVVKQIGFKTE